MTKGELTRQRIITSAMKMVGEKGFFEATLEEIALHAKVQRQGIINYFGGKTGLFRACVLQVLEDFGGEYQKKIKPEDSAWTQLNLQFELNLSMALRHSEKARLILFLYLHAAHEPQLQKIYQESIVRIRNRYHTVIAAGIREKLFKTDQPELVGALLHEIIVGTMINVLAHDGKPSEAKAAGLKWKLATNALLGGEPPNAQKKSRA